MILSRVTNEKNLVIGNSSQISHFLPNSDFLKINSREINYSLLDYTWEIVIIAFGENRKFIKDPFEYERVNVQMTLESVDFFSPRSERVIVFSTCELWSKESGPIDIDTPYNYFDTPYIISKKKMSDEIIGNKNYDNVEVLFPFNFNSTYRGKEFLFGKIFNSIIKETPIEIGDTYFYRDLIHPKFVVDNIMNGRSHRLVGSGRLVFVNDFIRDLYKEFNLSYSDLVSENLNSFQEYGKKYEYYLKSNECLYGYNDLLKETVEEIEKIKNFL